MKSFDKHLPLMVVLVVAILMLLPFLGLTEFNTKGEPREAVVALSMIKEGNWILPVNNGVDIPYKPPFFHYCIAVLSLLSGGVSEYTSRLPSALSLIALALGVFAFYRRRLSTTTAVVGAILLLTSFEVHRAGMNCRVDMVLTTFTVGAMLLLYRWWERGSRGLPVAAVLCMSCATLTKGPVGFVVPCLVMGVFSLLRGGKFWRTFLCYALLGIMSCVLPAIWYVAAWHEGGQHFLDLVYEENIGRMSGTMSYDSHVHPFTYNFLTLIIGWMPWVLLLLMSLLAKPWKVTGRNVDGNSRKETNGRTNGVKDRLARLRVRVMLIPPAKLFTWLGFLLVLFFYCLPSSKRSVYLLPCYPFMAIIIAEYIGWIWRTRRLCVSRAFVGVMAFVAVALTASLLAVRLGLVPDTIFHGKHAAENLAVLHALRDTPLDVLRLVVIVLPLLVAIDCLHLSLARSNRDNVRVFLYSLMAPVVALFIALEGFYQPIVLNTKSLKPMAAYIAKTFKGEPLYQYINSPMFHFFGADFYLDDSLKQFETPRHTTVDGRTVTSVVTPSYGVLVIPEPDFAELARRHPDYQFTHVETLDRHYSEVKSNVGFYRFRKIKRE